MEKFSIKQKLMIFLTVVFLLQGYAFLRAQTVIRILNGYVLFDSAEGMGKAGDEVEVQRKTGQNDILTGKVKLLLFKDGMSSGKIVEQDAAHPVRVGDVVRRKAVPKTAEPVQAAKPAQSMPAASSVTVTPAPSAFGQKPIPKTVGLVQAAKSASSSPDGSSVTATSAPTASEQSDSTKTVLRVVPGYVLIDPGKEPWKENSILRVLRKLNQGMLDVGDLKVVKRENGKLGAKILREREPYKIAPGDAVASVVQDFDIDTYFFGGFGGR
jgi:ribosomal protein S28E/S33